LRIAQAELRTIIRPTAGNLNNPALSTAKKPRFDARIALLASAGIKVQVSDRCDRDLVDAEIAEPCTRCSAD
jgi:hypothetical protein